MSMSIIGKKIATGIFQSVGINYLIKKMCFSNKFVILMYHRVINENFNKSDIQCGMYVETNTFEKHILYLKENYNVIPFSKIIQLFKGRNDKINRNNRPYCILTFDDGWSDFYKNAYPLIKNNGIFATVFLPTNYIGSKKYFWTDHISHLICRKNKNRAPVIAGDLIIKTIENLRGNNESKIEYAINILKNLSHDHIDEIIKLLYIRWDVNPIVKKDAFLAWNEVREMAKSGNILFGSHTDNHFIMTKLKKDEIYRELANSKELLKKERVVDETFIPFSYPNGNHNDEIVRMVKENGYHIAVTTINGWNNFVGEIDYFRLKRISIHQDMTSTISMFDSRILNIT